MSTNLGIDDLLLAEVQRAGKFKTKKETVNTALEELLKQIKRMEFLALRGTVEFDPKYDHKAGRRNRRI